MVGQEGLNLRLQLVPIGGHANGGVEAVAAKIDRSMRFGDRNPHVGMLVEKAGQAWDQPAHGEGAQAGNLQGADRVRAQPIDGLGHAVEGGAERRRQPDAVGRQPQPGLGAIDQRHAERLFELADLAADRAMGDAELLSGGRHAGVTTEGFEGAQSVQGGQGAALHVRKTPRRSASISFVARAGNGRWQVHARSETRLDPPSDTTAGRPPALCPGGSDPVDRRCL